MCIIYGYEKHNLSFVLMKTVLDRIIKISTRKCNAFPSHQLKCTVAHSNKCKKWTETSSEGWNASF